MMPTWTTSSTRSRRRVPSVASRLCELSSLENPSCGRSRGGSLEEARVPGPLCRSPSPRARASLSVHRAWHRDKADSATFHHAYGSAGQFPHNTTTAPSLHMFRDPEGRLCAVANLVQTDGRGDLVEATVRDAERSRDRRRARRRDDGLDPALRAHAGGARRDPDARAGHREAEEAAPRTRRRSPTSR